MILTALFLAETLAKPAPAWHQDNQLSTNTKQAYVTYVDCYARAAFDRMQSAGSPESRMMSAKASCRKQYDAAVEAAVKDAAGHVDAARAAAAARATLDEADGRIFGMLGPAPPPKLAELPIRFMAGEWRLGRGALAVKMTIRFTDKPSMAGTFISGDAKITSMNAGDLSAWEIVTDGDGRAVFRATFTDGRVASYERIPSPPGEMNFINTADSTVQRYDLLLEDEQFLIRWVKKDSAGQLRFRRHIPTGPDIPDGLR